MLRFKTKQTIEDYKLGLIDIDMQTNYPHCKGKEDQTSI